MGQPVIEQGPWRFYTDATPDGSMVALAGLEDLPLKGFIVRKAGKEHGTKSLVEGPLSEGDHVVVIANLAKNRSATEGLATVLLKRTPFASDEVQRLEQEIFAAYADPAVHTKPEALASLRAALAGHYGLAHIKEVALDEGFHIHAGLAPLGAGNTDWALMLGGIAPHMPEDSWVVLEHVATPEEGRNSLGILKTAAEKAGISLS